jgi:hypothetical protein
MNLTRIDVNSNESPFDSIRRYDEHGQEHWLARELMTLMGYQSWRRFETPIAQAMDNIELSGDVLSEHFDGKDKKSKGRPGNDYRMTRYACYMTALACDGRKPEVALAKKYFAVKTREAEVVIPQQNERLLLAQIELEKLKLENENLKLKTNYMERRNAIQELQGVQMLALLDGNVEVVEVKEKITESIICRNGRNVSFVGKSTAEVATDLKFKTTREFVNWLKSQKADHYICQGMRAIQADYIPEEYLDAIKNLFRTARSNGQRQLMIGE